MTDDNLDGPAQTRWYMWRAAEIPDEAKPPTGSGVGRRVRGYTVTGGMVAEMLSQSIELPDSCRFFNAYFDNERLAFVVLIEDESFDTVPDGCKIPIDVADIESVPDIVNAKWHCMKCGSTHKRHESCNL
jgi:hypothetical protein